jgi:hypothetical protein
MRYGADSRIYVGKFKTWYESCKYLAETLLSAVNARGHLEVEVSSQISPPVIVHAHSLQGTTILSADVAVGDLIINVVSATGAVVGDALTLTNPTTIRYYTGHITAIDGLAITVDTHVDQKFRADSSFVSFVTHDMNVDGTTTEVIFGLRQAETVNVPISVDITRMIWVGITDSVPNLSLFGDLPALLEGMAIRKKLSDGTYQNIHNIHSNLDFVNLAFDFDIYSEANPVQGVNGFACRFTLGGEEKLGTVIRVEPDEDLEIQINDDLTGLIEFTCMFMGAQVADDAIAPVILYDTRVDSVGNIRVDNLGNTRITKEIT